MTAISRSEPAVCDGTEPPTCCQSPMTPELWAERGRRLESIAEALFSRTPRWCSACGDRAVCPLFWSVDLFGCTGCGAVMSGRGD